MTDNEIKKALEICIMDDCEICSCRCGSVGDCRDALNKKSLDLINRLQAENERLKSIVLAFTNEVVIDGNGYYIKDLSYEKITYNAKKCLASIKAEAYKEFAERLKGTFPKDDFLRSTKQISKDIDNLLKEKVGEDRKEDEGK